MVEWHKRKQIWNEGNRFSLLYDTNIVLLPLNSKMHKIDWISLNLFSIFLHFHVGYSQIAVFSMK